MLEPWHFGRRREKVFCMTSLAVEPNNSMQENVFLLFVSRDSAQNAHSERKDAKSQAQSALEG